MPFGNLLYIYYCTYFSQDGFKVNVSIFGFTPEKTNNQKGYVIIYKSHSKEPGDQDSNLELFSTWPALCSLIMLHMDLILEIIPFKPFMFTHEETEAQVATVTHPGTEAQHPPFAGTGYLGASPGAERANERAGRG